MRKQSTLSLAIAALLSFTAPHVWGAFTQTFDTNASDPQGDTNLSPQPIAGYPGYVYIEKANQNAIVTEENNGIMTIASGELELDFNTPTAPPTNPFGSANLQVYRSVSDPAGTVFASVDIRGDNGNGFFGGGLIIGDLTFQVLPGSSASYFGVIDDDTALNFEFLSSEFGPGERFQPGVTGNLTISVSPNGGFYDFDITLSQPGITTKTFTYTSTASSSFNPALFNFGVIRAGGAPFAMTFDNLTFVPEPMTTGLLALGLCALARRRRGRSIG